MGDQHLVPCPHTKRIDNIHSAVDAISRAQGIALARVGISMDGTQVGNGHTILGRLDYAEERGDETAGEILAIKGGMVSKDDVQAIIDAAVTRATAARGEQKTNRIAAWGPTIAAFCALAGVVIVAALK